MIDPRLNTCPPRSPISLDTTYNPDMREMSWAEAIKRVLRDEGKPLHYADIAQAIIDRGYKTNVGATPAQTVAASISGYLQGVVVRTQRGVYALAEDGFGANTPAGSRQAKPTIASEPSIEADEDKSEMGLINAFGMFWRRSEARWDKGSTRLLGTQQSGSQGVNFAEQAGVYLLYDGVRVVYVGRVTEPRLGSRLWEHTRDRLSGRWDRFSWFGVRAVQDDGTLGPLPNLTIEVPTLIATMEALLIEGLEPPQNRRQGDGFNALEFIQQTDPEVARARKLNLLAELGQGLS